MICTNCSETVRPIVAIDIDGTLGDYHSYFMAFAEDYLNRLLDWGYDGEGSFRLWFEKMGVDAREYRDIKLAYRQGAQKRSMPAFQGAHFFTGRFIEAGAEVWITTTRPYLRLDGIDPDTRFWLAQHDIPYHGLLYHEDKYEILAERVEPSRVVAVLDDLPEQLIAAQHHFGNVGVLRETRWNKQARYDGKLFANVVETLADAERLILARIETWKGANW